MAEPQVPTEEEVKAANAAEEAKWQGDFKEEYLNIPYKKAAQEDEPIAGSDETAEDGKDEVDENDIHETPAPVVTTQDPGEYKPADYSFEVTLKDGKTTKISTPEDAEKLSDDPDNFETPRQLLDFIKKTTQMQNKLDKDYEKWESAKKTHDEQVETETSRQKTVQDLTNGFEYLIAKGYMPQLDPADAVADWNDPEVAKHAGVKEQIALINYMTKENASREKAGIPVLASALDAYNAWQLDSGRKQEEADKKAAGEARRTAGARVAGVAPTQQAPYVPKGIAVGNPNVLKRGAAVWDN